jgi:hypothetical protein
MKIKSFCIVAILVTIFNISNVWAISTISVSQGAPKHVRMMTNSVIAVFGVNAHETPFRLDQIAFNISASGAWIYHQVTNVRLLDENGVQISGAMRVWSTPIVCDCDSGRVIFDTITNFVVQTNSSRTLTVVADVDTGLPLNGIMTVMYSSGDSRIVEISSQVNSTLQGGGVLEQTPMVGADYAFISQFTLTLVPWTNALQLNLIGYMRPNTSYKVEASTNLVHWEEIGMVNNPGNTEILKEPAVGLIGPTYRSQAFFRLKKINE